jgi:16S rRNA (uracil1498-N3)-methyltransferase
VSRWQSVVTAAAEQSHRARLPEVTPPITLDEALASLDQPGLLAWEESDQPLRPALSECVAVGRLALFVGPEGGFTSEEVESARAAGVSVVSLGPRILRAETAGPLFAALALYQSGDI